MDFRKVQLFQKMSMAMVYRLFLKNMKYYPSKNRLQLLTTIQQQFHQNKSQTDPLLTKSQRTKAQMGLRHMYYYMAKNKQMSQNKKFHNHDQIQPFAKKKDDVVYF